MALGLPYVLKYNLPQPIVADKLAYLARRIDRPDFIAAIEELNKLMKIPSTLRDLGIMAQDFENDIPLLVDNAYRGSTLKNPRPVTRDDVAGVMRAMYYGN